MIETADDPAVLELREYTLHPGRRDELIELFERAFIEPQEALGIELPGLFRDADRPDRFIWLRAFADMPARKEALSAFYGGPVWRANADAANATMIDSDNVLLLRPAGPASGLSRTGTSLRGPVLVVTYALADVDACSAFARRFTSDVAPQLARHGAAILATYVTEPSENTFPRLPVRERDRVFVAFVDGISRERFLAHAPQPDALRELVPTTRSRVRLTHEGTPGDFDFLVGEWNVTHRKLSERLRKSTTWEVSTGTCRAHSLIDGIVSADEYHFPPSGMKGGSIRHLDLARRRWTIYWTTNRSGALFAPVHGGFAGDRGEFYGDDLEDGVPVLVRFVWSACTSETPRWEQAFSTDGGATWETNWIMEFRRP